MLLAINYRLNEKELVIYIVPGWSRIRGLATLSLWVEFISLEFLSSCFQLCCGSSDGNRKYLCTLFSPFVTFYHTDIAEPVILYISGPSPIFHPSSPSADFQQLFSDCKLKDERWGCRKRELELQDKVGNKDKRED